LLNDEDHTPQWCHGCRNKVVVVAVENTGKYRVTKRSMMKIIPLKWCHGCMFSVFINPPRPIRKGSPSVCFFPLHFSSLFSFVLFINPPRPMRKRFPSMLLFFHFCSFFPFLIYLLAPPGHEGAVSTYVHLIYLFMYLFF